MTDMVRYDLDRTITTVARWGTPGDDRGDDIQTPSSGSRGAAPWPVPCGAIRIPWALANPTALTLP